MTIHLKTIISDQGLCEDILKRASYIIPFFCFKENIVWKKMLSVKYVTKMLEKERKYNDRGIPWIHNLIYQSRTCCKKRNVKINDNTLIKYQLQLTKGRYDDTGSCQKEERLEILNGITSYPLSLL